jgi:hypothetical protein
MEIACSSGAVLLYLQRLCIAPDGTRQNQFAFRAASAVTPLITDKESAWAC